MSGVEFAILALASWRLVNLVTQDDGPAALFAHVRWAITGDGPVEAGSLSQLITCPYCLGVWVGLAVAAMWIWQPTATLLASLPLALAAMVSLLQQLTFDRHDESELPSGPPDQDSMLSG